MLVFLFIFSLIVVTFYSVWATGTRYILLVKNRLVASALANEKMEVVRNLAFDDIALTTGYPAGNLSQDEDIVRSGRTFHVFTQVRKVDDPFDGTLGGSPNDPNFVDYKYVKITVSWENGTQSISTSSRFVPAGIEQPVAGQGVLVVNVTSDKAEGALVPQSTVRVRKTDGGFDETHSTDNFGRLMLVGVPGSMKKYEITLTKSGYETVSTFAPYPDGGPYNPPVHEHASVIAGALNTIDMYQNELSNFSVKTTDYLGSDAADINYHLKGGKKLGTDPIPPNGDVYSTDIPDQTNSSGEKNYGAISPGDYNFTLEETGYKIIGINPGTAFTLTPGSPTTLTVKVSPENVTALLVNVTDGAGGPPVFGAQCSAHKWIWL